MVKLIRSIKDKNGNNIRVTAKVDKRLKKSIRWSWQQDGSIQIRTPNRMTKRNINSIIRQLSKQINNGGQVAKRRTDTGLQKRAEYIKRKYFGKDISWRAIRWVGNMEKRLGSCTTGGPTDGHIRISDKIKEWSQWVIDYVIAHELLHRKIPRHGKEFWLTLENSFPLTERARGFIEGIGYPNYNYKNGD